MTNPRSWTAFYETILELAVYLSAHHARAGASGLAALILFFSAALALIPIASLIVQATEQIAVRTGDAVGGLLNATFGNAPELIIGLVALKAGYLDMVRASLIGAILANLLLALGISFSSVASAITTSASTRWLLACTAR